MRRPPVAALCGLSLIPLTLAGLPSAALASTAAAGPPRRCDTAERFQAALEGGLPEAHRASPSCVRNPRPTYASEQLLKDLAYGFTVHYTTDAADPRAITTADAKRAADALRASLGGLAIEGFPAPADDSGDAAVYCDEGHGGDGGDGSFDLYIVQDASLYGYTQPTSYLGGSPYSAASFMGLSAWTFGSEGAAEVTIAHELTHTSQSVLDVQESTFWMEQSAVWMEEVVYPSVNDYLGFVPTVFNAPQTPLDSNGPAMFGYGIWPMFLEDHVGFGTVREIWDVCARAGGQAFLTAQQEVLDRRYEGGYAQALLDFRGAMYDTEELRDGALMTTPVAKKVRITTYPWQGSYDLDHTAGDYLAFRPGEGDEPGTLKVSFWFHDVDTRAQLYARGIDGDIRPVGWTYFGDVVTSAEIPGFGEDVDEVVMVVTHATSAREVGGYDAAAELLPDDPPPATCPTVVEDGRAPRGSSALAGILTALALGGAVALRRRG